MSYQVALQSSYAGLEGIRFLWVLRQMVVIRHVSFGK